MTTTASDIAGAAEQFDVTEAELIEILGIPAERRGDRPANQGTFPLQFKQSN